MVALGILYGVLALVAWIGFAVYLVVGQGFAMDDGQDVFETLGLSFWAALVWPLTLLIGGVAFLVIFLADWYDGKR